MSRVPSYDDEDLLRQSAPSLDLLVQYRLTAALLAVGMREDLREAGEIARRMMDAKCGTDGLSLRLFLERLDPPP